MPLTLLHRFENTDLSHCPEQYADSIVKHLFSVGLHLNTALDNTALDNTALGQTNGPEQARLNQAIEELDTAIQGVQRIALAQVGRHRPPARSVAPTAARTTVDEPSRIAAGAP
jgi:hypothetical protein